MSKATGCRQRAVVFDFGAVLFRWQPAELLQGVVPEHAPDRASAVALGGQIFQSFTPDSDWAQFDLGRVEAAELAQRIGRRTGLPVDAVARVIHAACQHLVVLPDSLALMRGLKAAGHRVFYLSNMPLSYADHLERVNPFIGEFEDGIYSSRVGLMKPWPALFQMAQARFGLDAVSQTLFIDDNAHNIAACEDHGWEGLHFMDAAQAEGELVRRGWLSLTS
jgi:putative hydrolase of the HAD superfamily